VSLNDKDQIDVVITSYVVAHSGDNNPLTQGQHNINVENAMQLGSYLESQWRIKAAGGGAFQITDHVNFDPTDIHAAVAYMFPRYENAVNGIPNFEGDRKNNSAKAAFIAERPQVMYPQDRIDAGWKEMGNLVSNPSTAVPGALSGANAFLEPVVKFLGDLSDIRLWRSLGWLLLGIVLFILGLALWLKKSTPLGKVI
jgi:hypothetical protein